jgi:hypothetical protein
LRYGTGGAIRSLPGQAGLHLAAHHFEGDVIHGQMMEQQNPHHPIQRRITAYTRRISGAWLTSRR